MNKTEGTQKLNAKAVFFLYACMLSYALSYAHQTTNCRHYPAYRRCGREPLCSTGGRVGCYWIFSALLFESKSSSHGLSANGDRTRRQQHNHCCRHTHHLRRQHEGYTGFFTMIAYSIVRCGADILPAVDALVMHLSKRTTKSLSKPSCSSHGCALNSRASRHLRAILLLSLD